MTIETINEINAKHIPNYLKKTKASALKGSAAMQQRKNLEDRQKMAAESKQHTPKQLSTKQPTGNVAVQSRRQPIWKTATLPRSKYVDNNSSNSNNKQKLNSKNNNNKLKKPTDSDMKTNINKKTNNVMNKDQKPYFKLTYLTTP